MKKETAAISLFLSVLFLIASSGIVTAQENGSADMDANTLLEKLMEKRNSLDSFSVNAEDTLNFKDRPSTTYTYEGTFNLTENKYNAVVKDGDSINKQTVSNGSAVWELQTGRGGRQSYESYTPTKLVTTMHKKKLSSKYNPYNVLTFGNLSRVAAQASLENLKNEELELKKKDGKYTLSGDASSDGTTFNFEFTVNANDLTPVKRTGDFTWKTRRGSFDISFETTFNKIKTDPELKDADFEFSAPEKAQEKTQSLKSNLGKKIGSFKLNEVMSGEEKTLSDYSGKVVLLNVWRTWCGPCKKEIPALIDLHKKYKDKGFTVVGTANDSNESLEQVKKFIKDNGINYPVLDEKSGETPGLYSSIRAVPTTFFLDKNGVIQNIITGARPKSAFEEQIKVLLDISGDEGKSGNKNDSESEKSDGNQEKSEKK